MSLALSSYTQIHLFNGLLLYSCGFRLWHLWQTAIICLTNLWIREFLSLGPLWGSSESCIPAHYHPNHFILRLHDNLTYTVQHVCRPGASHLLWDWSHRNTSVMFLHFYFSPNQTNFKCQITWIYYLNDCCEIIQRHVPPKYPCSLSCINISIANASSRV